MNSCLRVMVTERAASQVRQGSLWIFANEFVTKMRDLTAGAWVEFESKTEFVGYGYVNPHSLIAGRVLSRSPIEDRLGLFKKHFQKAKSAREELNEAGSYRMVFSESDNLPGLIVDQYKTPDHQTILVAQSTTAGMDSAIDDWSEIILDIFKPDAFIARGDSSIRTLEGVKPFKKIFKGHEGKLQSEGALIEYDVLYAADFLNGQKTGFFLDQRENRKHLKDHARGKRVLDLCCYSGGWGLAALKGGANHVTFVDQSADALNLVHRGLKLNGFSTDAPTVNLIEADIFEYLEKSRDYFDIVVSDPPAFVKSKKNLPQAIKAYQKLNSLALKRINPEGGLLYTCSCSYHLSEEEFLKIVANSVRWHGNAGKVILSSGQGLDHPWIINRPESRYLKCACIQI